MKDTYQKEYENFQNTITWKDILSYNLDLHINYIIKEHIDTKKEITDNISKK